jgi:hypothetical protein
VNIRTLRYGSFTTHTPGILCIEGMFECFTLEDPIRLEKIPGETAIPAGRYQIKMRNEGTMVKRYKEKFHWHGGMLWLQDVPGFEWVYIHIGNYVRDTEGCILVGEKPVTDPLLPMIGSSTGAYVLLYKEIERALNAGEEVWISVGAG